MLGPSKLYRCYVIYSANLWAIVFPCLIYLGSLSTCSNSLQINGTTWTNVGNVAMGILTLYQASIPVVISDVWFGYPYFSISIFLNVLLTFMIIIRLIVYTRNARTALGITGIGGLSKIIVIMLIESCALYTMSSSLVVGVIDIFLPILAENQVCAFPRLRSSDRLPDVTDWIGHRCTTHHSTSSQQERVDERNCCLRAYQFVQSQKPRGADGLSRW